MPERDVAQAEVADEALFLEFDEGGQRLGDGKVAGAVDAADLKVDAGQNLLIAERPGNVTSIQDSAQGVSAPG